MTTVPEPAASKSAARTHSSAVSQQSVPLTGDQLGYLRSALENAFTLDELRQLLRTELNGANVNLDVVVPVQDRTLREICHDLVLWALREENVGLQGLLNAGLRSNPANPQLRKLQKEWDGITFTAPACPYPGMKPFTTEERAWFYGREAEAKLAVDRLRRHPFLAIIGSSGAGKSSFLAAGILPALKTSHHFAGKDWVVHTLRPGIAPVDTLAAALRLPSPPSSAAAESGPTAGAEAPQLPVSAAGKFTLLVVDQYEELFTIAQEAQRLSFEQALLQLLHASDLCLLVAVRADFYSNLMASPLWPYFQEHRLEITPLHGDALRRAIALPAAGVGVKLEPELVERLLADAGEEPGVLPFIQETLVMLWAHADQFTIGLDAYTDLVGDKSGRSGLQVALAEHAEHVYRDVLDSDQERDLARCILLRLIQFGEGRADTRRQQTIGELGKGLSDSSAFERAIAVMTANRLLTLSDEARRVDISHESLITGWPRLREWIDKRRTAEKKRRRFEDKTTERQELRQSGESGGLLDAVELAECEAWIGSPDAADLGVSADLKALVADSRKAIDAAAWEKERAANRLRKRNQGLAIALVAALAATIVAVGFYLSALKAETAAQKTAVEAENQRATAVAERLVALKAGEATRAQRDRAEKNAADAESSKREAQETARRARAGELAAYAQSALESNRNDPSLALLLALNAVAATRDADGSVTVNADRALRDAVAAAPPYRMTIPGHHHGAIVNHAAYSPDGRYILTASNDGTAQIWDASTGEELNHLTGHSDFVTDAAYSPDGLRVVTASSDGTARTWDAATGKLRVSFTGHGGPVLSAEFSPDGTQIVTASTDQTARIWDAATGKVLVTLAGHGLAVRSASFSPTGAYVVTGSEDSIARIWDAATGKEIRRLTAGAAAINSAAYSPDGMQIVTASQDGTVRIWDPATGNVRLRFPVSKAAVNSAVYSPDGTHIVTASGDQTAAIWDAGSGKNLGDFLGHEGGVNNAAFSPDGNSIVTASNDETVRIWDADTHTQLDQFNGHSATVNTAVFSPDGRRILTASNDDTARIWDAFTGEEIQQLRGHSGWVTDAAFSPDGRRVVTVSNDGTTRMWDPITGKQLAELSEHEGSYQAAGRGLGSQRPNFEGDADLDVLTGRSNKAASRSDDQPGALLSVAYSPDGKRIISTGADGRTRIWDPIRNSVIRELDVQSGAVWAAAYMPGVSTSLGPKTSLIKLEYIVTAGEDKIAHIWDANTGTELRQLKGHNDNVNDVAFSPSGRYIVTASFDDTARIWEAATGDEVRPLVGHTGYVMSAAYSPDGLRIVTASADQTARIWDAATGQELRRLTGHEGTVMSAVFSPDGKRIVTASADHTARIWDASTGEELHELAGPSAPFQYAAYSPDGRYILTADGEQTARIWDTTTGEKTHELKSDNGSVWFAAFSPDGQTAVTASDDHTARTWDVATGREVNVLSGHGDKVRSAAFSPDGRRIVTASDDHTARIWVTATGNQLRSPLVHGAPVSSAFFSTDGKRIVTACADSVARIWDATTGKEILALAGHRGPVLWAKYSPDGQTVVTAGYDRTVRVWDAQTGKEMDFSPLNQHSDTVFTAEYSPDGRFIVSASADQTARIWDAATGKELRELSGHGGAVLSAAYSPDGRRIVTVSQDGTARTWVADIDELIAAARRLIQREPPQLTPQERRHYGPK